jgi:hypothetical protein
MKRIFLTLIVIVAAVATASAQTNFPGVTPEARKQLKTAKRSLGFALPTWVPAGFTISRVQTKLGRGVKVEEKEFVVVYSRQVANGKMQRFAFEAGFDGLGDLMYESSKRLRTPVGTVYLVYQPKDEDGKKLLDFAMTEWFNVGSTAFHYIGTYGEEEGSKSLSMLSLADTEKILKSLKRY